MSRSQIKARKRIWTGTFMTIRVNSIRRYCSRAPAWRLVLIRDAYIDPRLPAKPSFFFFLGNEIGYDAEQSATLTAQDGN